MAEKISIIREKLQAAAVTELPVLLSAYEPDERAGVQAEIARAKKRLLAYEKEIERTEALKRYEREYAAYAHICGIDEVGRGPLAGPVVAGAVILPKDCDILYINDSKKLSEKKREELYDVIMEKAVAVGLGYSTPERIDEINILQATYEAMREAVGKLSVTPDILLNDAVTIPQVSIRQVSIIKGDAKSISIGAASIVAKVTRDRLMVQYDEVYPMYGFASNKGYGAQSHIDALKTYGPCPIHRKSFIKILRGAGLNLGSIFKKENQSVKASETTRALDSMGKGERIRHLQNEVRALKPGQTLQGMVVSRDGNSVQIELAQDFAINAKIDKSVSLALGQMMSFEVKANSSSFMSLAPLYTNTANTATILRALSAAGMPETAANIEMVAKMMEEGMPIDKESILNMSRLLLDFPGKDPTSIIQMTRLGLPVTEANIEQFEQYRNANHQILSSAQTIADQLPQAFAELVNSGQGERAIAFYQAVIEIFTEDGTGADGTVTVQPQEGAETSQTGDAVQTAPGGGENVEASQTAENAGGQTQNTASAETAGQSVNAENTALKEQPAGVPVEELPQPGTENADRSQVLSQGQWERLGNALRELGMNEEKAAQVKNGTLTPKDVLQFVRQLLSKAPEQALQKLLGGKEFQALLKDQIGRQWTIEPQNVADKKQVEQLYERIREQTARLSQALEAAGKGDVPVARSVQNLQSNVDFMNQMNHLYTYVQLPLKMLGNNAHGDLYVYTNKKNLAARDGQVSALLHLDMEHLGPLDVYVTMKDKQVATNFTVADESVLDLIVKNIETLNKRLEGRGYSLKAQMHVKEDVGEEEDSSIMQTLLSQQKNISVLSRTSFDMRA